jgi:hypothetical protein
VARKKKDDQAPPPMPVGDELTQELAAVTLAVLDKESERGETVKRFNSEIKKLKKRQRDIATEIKSGGRQLRMLFDPNTEADEVH